MKIPMVQDQAYTLDAMWVDPKIFFTLDYYEHVQQWE